EQYTFNVWALGSSPSGITVKTLDYASVFFYWLLYFCESHIIHEKIIPNSIVLLGKGINRWDTIYSHLKVLRAAKKLIIPQSINTPISNLTSQILYPSKDIFLIAFIKWVKGRQLLIT